MSNTVKLQGIYGQQKGTATKDLIIGDVCIWDYGMKSEVVGITPSKTGKTIVFQMKSLQDGVIRERKMGADSLVVIEERKEEKHPIKKAIDGREHTHNSIYSDIGLVLDNFTTEELAEYYIKVLKCGSCLRDYLEQQIIASEINR